MAQRDLLKRYLDAGMAFTAMSKKRAEGIVRELVRAGEVQRDQVQNQVDELLERSRRNTDNLVALVRREVSSQLTDLATSIRDELRAFESRFTAAGGGGSPTAGSAPSADPSGESVATPEQGPAPSTATPAKARTAKKAPTQTAPAKTTPTQTAGAKAPATSKATPAKPRTAKKAPGTASAQTPRARSAPGRKAAVKTAAADQVVAEAPPASAAAPTASTTPDASGPDAS